MDRTQLRQAARFFLGLVVVLAAANALAAKTELDGEGAKYQELFGSQAPTRQVLLGTSHVLTGVNPAQLERPGFAPYNFGFGGATPTFLLAFYQDLERYYAPPRLVLLGLDPLLLKRTPWNRRYEQDSEHWPLSLLGERLAQRDADVATLLLDRFPLVKQREAIQNRLTGVKAGSRYMLEKAYRGFVPVEPNTHLELEGTDFPDDAGYVADLDRLLERLRADGVKVVAFQTPEYLASTGDHKVDNAHLADVARRFGLPFLNYNAERRSVINTTARFFNDGGHLNVLGAEAFGRVFARDLAAGRYTDAL